MWWKLLFLNFFVLLQARIGDNEVVSLSLLFGAEGVLEDTKEGARTLLTKKEYLEKISFFEEK